MGAYPSASTSDTPRIPSDLLSGKGCHGFAEAFDCIVDALIEFDESIGWPKTLLKFFFGNELAGFFKKNKQHRKRLVLELDAHAMLAQLAGGWVELEDPESQRFRRGSPSQLLRVSESPSLSYPHYKRSPIQIAQVPVNAVIAELNLTPGLTRHLDSFR